jgi:hypothetical protein
MSTEQGCGFNGRNKQRAIKQTKAQQMEDRQANGFGNQYARMNQITQLQKDLHDANRKLTETTSFVGICSMLIKNFESQMLFVTSKNLCMAVITPNTMIAP